MRLLLLADSHGKGMLPLLHTQAGLLEPPLDLQQFHVIRGRSIEIIRGDYRNELANIMTFSPDRVLIHAGHNNMVRHDIYNRNPLFITAVVHILLEFVVEVRASFPNTEIFVSTLLPRKASRQMSSLEATQYNRICKRFGQHVLSNQLAYNYVAVLNRPFWLRISLCEPNGLLLSSDGLHVTNTGRGVLAELWLNALTHAGSVSIAHNPSRNQDVRYPVSSRNIRGGDNRRGSRVSLMDRNAQRGASMRSHRRGNRVTVSLPRGVGTHRSSFSTRRGRPSRRRNF